MIVDFHILKENSTMQGWLFACSLIEKAHLAKHSIYVHTASKEEAERLDNLLWTFKDDSFIPHQLATGNNNELATTYIGYGESSAPIQKTDTVINLSNQPLPNQQSTNRIIEIVFNDPVMQQLARERYKQYREQQYEINTIKN